MLETSPLQNKITVPRKTSIVLNKIVKAGESSQIGHGPSSPLLGKFQFDMDNERKSVGLSFRGSEEANSLDSILAPMAQKLLKKKKVAFGQ